MPRLVGLIVLLALTLIKYSDPAPLERFRLWLFDHYVTAKPREAGQSPVVVVDVDENSIARIGQWPWSRAVLADLVERAGAAGAAAIGFDIVFPEPDRLSPPRLADTLAGLTPEMRQGLKGDKDTDALFAAAIARHRVVLGRSGLPQANPAKGDDPHLPLAMIGGDSTGLLPA